MNRPWEIMMNFQKNLKPGAAGGGGKTTTQVQLSAAAQRFLPSTTVMPSRTHKVRNIINESTRIIEESRLPELNNTTASFCQNCTCDNCSNASILNGTQLNNPNINTLYLAFENFLQAQKQQFVTMIQQIASLDSSASTDFFTSSRSCSQPALTECDSSEKTKSRVAVSSNAKSTERNGATTDTRLATSSSEIPTRALDRVDESELSDCTVTAAEEFIETKMNLEECIKDETLKNEDEKDSKNNPGNENQHLEGSCACDFDNYIDESFKPVRRSSILKMRDSFVLLENLDTVKEPLCDVMPLKPETTGSIDRTILVEKSNFTAPSNSKNKMKLFVPPVDATCTRSGRALKKPQPYWTAASRVGIKEEFSVDIKEEAIKPRRVGRNVSNKIKPKQNVQKKSKKTVTKSVLSKEDISCDVDSKSELPSTSSRTQKHNVVSSSSDALVPTGTGAKRGRKKKSATNSESTHATRDASKNISAKRRKIESQISESSSMYSDDKQISSSAAKPQNIRSKRNTRRGIQNENTAVGPGDIKDINQTAKVKNEILKSNRVNLRKPTRKGEDNALLQSQNSVRYPSLSGNLSSASEPEYECYLDDNLSD
ncbi:serine-rich adhesin for platelets-like [Thrips palmi]|uniref:Serine-rich adhesin for platelets-like n=1 Tax=Thrips palmi TaxID=161013 RepID=A0A6P8YBW4_THRPL|nr:serine-rich adhesin for platelets-like [Thrips palmi]